MTTLSGKEIVLGVTGGIAAYKACEIVRVLRKEGAGVRVILTASGARSSPPSPCRPFRGTRSIPTCSTSSPSPRSGTSPLRSGRTS